MQLMPIGTGLSHSVIYLASFSKYCESKRQMHVFDEVINFIESEKIGFTKEDIKNAKEKIDKQIEIYKKEHIESKLARRAEREEKKKEKKELKEESGM